MITSEDVVTQESVQAMVQAATEATYGFRQLFRDHNGSAAGPSMKFPLKTQDFEGAMEEVEQGTEYPKYDVKYGDVEAVYTKYGFETDITDEAVSDGIIDIRLDQTQDMIREETRRMDAIAAGIVSGNRLETTYGNDDGTLSFDEVVDARAKFRKETEDGKDAYNPDILLVEPLGAADILKDDAFKLRDTPVGDRAVTQGFIGAVAGMDIFETNARGVLGDYEAYICDTSQYGYESSKYRQVVDVRRDDSQDKTTYKIRDRLDWVSTDPDAAALIAG